MRVNAENKEQAEAKLRGLLSLYSQPVSSGIMREKMHLVGFPCIKGFKTHWLILPTNNIRSEKIKIKGHEE
jgi:hypothetical protein